MTPDELQRTGNPAQDHQAALERLIQQHNSIAEAEEMLREQRAELMRTMTFLGELLLNSPPPGSGELDALRAENEQLRRLVAERDRALEEAESRPSVSPEQEEANRRLTTEVSLLRQQLQGKDTQVRELQKQIETLKAASPESMEIAEYEAELNEFRRQLEADRQTLNQELQQLRARNQELNETARQAELDLSRERAQLARERAQLDRLREEIRLELERAQRDGAVRERLASVQKLKDRLG